jgi:hypothetical protein
VLLGTVSESDEEPSRDFGGQNTRESAWEVRIGKERRGERRVRVEADFEDSPTVVS